MNSENFVKVTEQFQIKFLCEIEDNFPYEDEDVKAAMKDTFYDEPDYLRIIKHIEITLNEGSSGIGEELLRSLMYHLNSTLLECREDFITIPAKFQRINVTFDSKS